MTLREEYESLAAIVAAAKGTPAWAAMDKGAMLDAALSLCLRALEAETQAIRDLEGIARANNGELLARGAEIARLRSRLADAEGLLREWDVLTGRLDMTADSWNRMFSIKTGTRAFLAQTNSGESASKEASDA